MVLGTIKRIKNMKKIIVIIIVLVLTQVNAQTGIGTTTPNASAKLDVYSTNKGFLPPRVTLSSATDAATIPSPAVGLLVYNVGSVGLQAGYYYWNGANWATIATASLAGTSVTASDLVKLYQEVYSTTNGKAPSTSGYSFTVPVSGRYEFNFNSTGWNSNGSILKLTFNVRNGTTILASDYHQSTSSNIWAEYEGRVEVNLNVGETYNVQVVTTSGSRDYRDYDKIQYKLVAGNLPINQYTLGDIKTGIQTGDHNGWVKLDGRLKSNLTASQQIQANVLGIGTNLPDATNAVLMQSGGTLGTITGSMTTTLAQNQLPNIAPTITVNNTVATMQNSGSHQHPVAIVPSTVGGYAAGNPSAFKNGMAPTTEADADLTDRSGTATYSTTGIIGSAGTHSHTMDTHNHTATATSINGGVTQQTIDKTPRSLVVNTFIYLGY
jgi:hypothetical protein